MRLKLSKKVWAKVNEIQILSTWSIDEVFLICFPGGSAPELISLVSHAVLRTKVKGEGPGTPFQ